MNALGAADSLWGTLATMVSVAVLFMLFGMLRLRGEEHCGGGEGGAGCASCNSVCHRRPAGDEDHHVA